MFLCISAPFNPKQLREIKIASPVSGGWYKSQKIFSRRNVQCAGAHLFRIVKGLHALRPVCKRLLIIFNRNDIKLKLCCVFLPWDTRSFTEFPTKSTSQRRLDLCTTVGASVIINHKLFLMQRNAKPCWTLLLYSWSFVVFVGLCGSSVGDSPHPTMQNFRMYRRM